MEKTISPAVKGKLAMTPALAALLATSALVPQFANAQAASTDRPQALEEVVVTAQRREESLQRAALAVQAISGQQLQRANVLQLTDIGRLAPAVQIEQNGGAFIGVTMRGVASSDINEFGSPAIAMSLDGVYMPRSTSPQGIFYDIARVEVLKGPQGTLYGRNTAAGAINFITNAPQLGKFGAEAQVSAGNYDLFSGTGSINVPLADNLAARGAFQIVHRNGYFSDGAGDDKHQSGRLSLKWEPSSNLSVVVRGDYTHIGGKGAGGSGWCIGTPTRTALGGYRPDCDPTVGQFWSSPYTSTADLASTMMRNAAVNFPLGAPLSSGMVVNPPGRPPGVYWPVYTNADFIPDAFAPVDALTARPYVDDTNWSISGQLDWTTAAGTLTVIPALRKERVNFLTTEPGDTIREISKTTQYTLEARFASNPERRLKYIVGGFYAHENQPGQPSYDTQGYIVPPLVFSSVAFPQAPTLEVETTHNWGWSAAAFANATFSVTDAFRLTGGVRFTRDDKQTEDTLNAVNYFVSPNYITNTFPTGPGATDAKGTVLLPGPGPQALAYPAFGVPNIFTNTGHRKWSSWNWKVGLEWDLTPSSLLYANVSTGNKSGGFFLAPPGFTNSYEPEKITSYTLGSKNRFFDRKLQLNFEAFYWDYQNQQISGFQLDGPFLVLATQNAQKAVVRGVEIESQYLLTPNTLLGADVQYTDAYYKKFLFSSIFPNGNCKQLTASTFDCTGNRLLNAPLWVVTFSLQQTIPLSRGDSVVFYFGGRHESRRPGGLGLSPYQSVPNNTRLDANVTYEAPGGRWSVQAWVKNLGNLATPLGAGGAFGSSQIFSTLVRPPRTFGATVSAHF